MMSTYKNCTVCKQYHHVDDPCDDIYFIEHEEYLGDEKEAVRAKTFYDAAEKYAMSFNGDNILLNDDIDVIVWNEDLSESVEFNLSAEVTVQYNINRT